MKKYAVVSLLIFIVTISLVSTGLAQSQGSTLVNVRVKDAASGRPMREAEVTMYVFRGKLPGNTKSSSVDKKLLLNKETGNPDSEGSLTFEVKGVEYLVTVIVEANDGQMISRHTPDTRMAEINDHSGVVNIELVLSSSDKGVFIHVTEEDGDKPVYNAKVTIKNADNLKDLVEYTDGNGNSFSAVTLVDNSKTFDVIIEKKGYKPALKKN